MLNFNELVDGKEYIGVDAKGNEYRGTFVNDYVPGGVFFCILPSQDTKLIGYKEVVQ